MRVACRRASADHPWRLITPGGWPAARRLLITPGGWPAARRLLTTPGGWPPAERLLTTPGGWPAAGRLPRLTTRPTHSCIERVTDRSGMINNSYRRCPQSWPLAEAVRAASMASSIRGPLTVTPLPLGALEAKVSVL